MGSKERQERERLQVRQSMLDAARDLFIAEGYRNVSMRKIAERVEYSAAAIYSYFPSKDDIFFALAEEGFRKLADHILRAVMTIDDPLDRLRAGLGAFYEFSKIHSEYFELMFLDRSVPSLNQDFERFEFFTQTTARAEADIRACIARGQFSKDLDPAAAIHVLWVGVLGAASIGLAQRLAPGEDPDALAHDIVEAVLSGFTTGVGTRFIAAACPFHVPTPQELATGVPSKGAHDNA